MFVSGCLCHSCFLLCATSQDDNGRSLSEGLLKSSSFYLISCWTICFVQWPESKCLCLYVCVCVYNRQKWCSVQGSSGWAWSSSQSPRWSLTWPTKCESSLRSLCPSSHQYTFNTGNSSSISSWNSRVYFVDFWESVAFPFCEYSIVNIFCFCLFQSVRTNLQS